MASQNEYDHGSTVRSSHHNLGEIVACPGLVFLPGSGFYVYRQTLCTRGHSADAVLTEPTREDCRMKLRSAAASVCLLVVAAAIHVAPVHAAPINGLVIFGDSLSDPGNNALAFGSTASPPFNVTLQSEIISNAFIPTPRHFSTATAASGRISSRRCWDCRRRWLALCSAEDSGRTTPAVARRRGL